MEKLRKQHASMTNKVEVGSHSLMCDTSIQEAESEGSHVQV